ncbi:hypothetical protein MNBD_ALPHA06-1873 [hydrothermal vent metagenome]|uniref:Uncharacterized protein n=1 Tax=hydrothermal vent metagenome TaxID=652676 RepID=A0A3B0RNA2_9ZZZZ
MVDSLGVIARAMTLFPYARRNLDDILEICSTQKALGLIPIDNGYLDSEFETYIKERWPPRLSEIKADSN